MTKPGTKEQALRDLREENIKQQAQAPHEDDIPEFLRRQPQPPSPVADLTPGQMLQASLPTLSVDKAARDWRIPKGMSDEEGKAMLERRAQEKKDKAAKRIADMKEKKAAKDAETLAAINTKRIAQGLDPLETLEAKKKAKPAKAEAEAQPQEDKTMRSKTDKKKSKANARSKANGKSKGNGKSKTDTVVSMLRRENGCTRKQVLETTGWPSLSFQALAKSAAVKLKVEKKKGEPTRYYAA